MAACCSERLTEPVRRRSRTDGRGIVGAVKEVNAPTALLLFDAVEHHGLDSAALWDGLPVDRERLNDRNARIDWEVWVEMIARAEAAWGEDLTESRFVAGSGVRHGHPFVRLANAFLALEDLYALFARWGLSRSLTVARASFESRGGGSARFTIDIDAARAGSLPGMRFMTGLLRSMPMLQGLPPATIRMEPGATPHHAVYDLVLPPDNKLLTRARRLLRMAGGASAALDELEQQATEIATQKAAIEEQLLETRRAASILGEREEWLQLALEAGKLGIWRWDPQTHQVYLSEALAHWLGLPGQGEYATSVWTARIHPDDQPELAATMRRAVDQRAKFDHEYRIFRMSGEIGFLQIQGRVLVDPTTQALAVLGAAVDVTDNKHVETKLRFADRLIAAGMLASGVAHEINNPLTYVFGNLELIRRKLRDFPQVEPHLAPSIAHIVDGVERIRDVVADLRAFARPEEEVITRIEPRTVCDAAIRIVSSLVRHRATVTTDYADDTPAVRANESRLGQVLINLIVNASHAMPERSATDNHIRVSTRRLPGGEAALVVTDNGSGIAPEIQARLFDPFFTTKAAGEGTGLGLAVCQSIVASLEGRIEVDSAPGRGATFTVVLPAAPPVDGSGNAPEPAIKRSAVHHRVLVIDDEALVRTALSRLLAGEGHTVLQAESGRAGLALAASDREIDVVICDLMMPDLDGAGVHAELMRERPELARHMIMISGGAVTQRTRDFVERPDIVMLEKPFKIDEVLQALDRVARR
jgi:PAS domain S-box-containing protein